MTTRSAELDAVPAAGGERPAAHGPATSAAPLGLSRGVLLSLAAVWLIWSSTYYALRVAVLALPPFWVGGVRYFVAGLVLVAFARARGDAFPKGRAWLGALAIGLLLFVVGNGFVAYASREIGSGIVAIVCGTMPLWGALLGRFLGAPVSRRELLGLGAGFAAVALLSWGNDLSGSALAVGLLVLAPIGWALGSLLVRRIDLGSATAGSGVQMLLGGAGLLVVAAGLGEPMVPAEAPLEAWAAIAYLVVAGSLVGFVAYQFLLREARPALAMSYAYVNPVLAVALGATVGGEHVSTHALVALALIAAAVVAIVSRKTPAHAAPDPSASARAPRTRAVRA